MGWTCLLSLDIDIFYCLCILAAEGFKVINVGQPLPLDQTVQFLFSVYTRDSEMLPQFDQVGINGGACCHFCQCPLYSSSLSTDSLTSLGSYCSSFRSFTFFWFYFLALLFTFNLYWADDQSAVFQSSPLRHLSYCNAAN